MQAMLRIARLIDRLNDGAGRIAVWCVLLSCLISAGNASIRYTFSWSSNAWLEIQWYLFAYLVMLGAAQTLRRNEHVRVDVLYGRYGPRTKAWVDLLGLMVFLLPVTVLLAWMSWPLFRDAWVSGEYSGNAGGLIRWPAKLALPLGFALLTLQGLGEIVKRVGYLRGVHQMDTQYERPLQ